jgi:hypothetical protein
MCERFWTTWDSHPVVCLAMAREFSRGNLGNFARILSFFGDYKISTLRFDFGLPSKVEHRYTLR